MSWDYTSRHHERAYLFELNTLVQLVDFRKGVHEDQQWEFCVLVKKKKTLKI